MPRITVNLSNTLYSELLDASARVNEHGFGPASWAQEAIEAALASRRLPKIEAGSHGPRIAINSEPGELEGFPVLLPEDRRNHGRHNDSSY
jgi:hypothetical protein